MVHALYDPELIQQIRQARAELYAAQAKRRRAYLLTNIPPVPIARLNEDVAAARAALDAARAEAAETSEPLPDGEV